MTIRAVFRVQCDGPCRGWLSRTHALDGTELPDLASTWHDDTFALLFPGERAARMAAQANGWYVSSMTGGVRALCPQCNTNPFGITLPTGCTECGHVHRSRDICRVPLSHMTICACDGVS